MRSYLKIVGHIKSSNIHFLKYIITISSWEFDRLENISALWRDIKCQADYFLCIISFFDIIGIILDC